MKTLQLTITDRLAVITLDRGRSNPINSEMLTELIAVVKDIEANDEIHGMMITGKEGFFSTGIDLLAASSYDREESKNFWTQFLAMQTVLSAFTKPFVTAVTGHSPAGGCIIAMCSDYRVMANGRFIIGLNEVPVGIIVPDAVFHQYAFWLGSPEEVIASAEKKVRQYMAFNPVTWGESKLNLRRELLTHLQKDNSDTLDKMLTQWWAPETRAILQKVIDQLTNPVKK